MNRLSVCILKFDTPSSSPSQRKYGPRRNSFRPLQLLLLILRINLRVAFSPPFSLFRSRWRYISQIGVLEQSESGYIASSCVWIYLTWVRMSDGAMFSRRMRETIMSGDYLFNHIRVKRAWAHFYLALFLHLRSTSLRSLVLFRCFDF
jgi:hypothetical protein